MTLRTKVLISLVATAVLPLAVAMIIAVRDATVFSRQRAIDLAQARLDTAALQLSGFMASRCSEIDALASMPLLQSMNWTRIEPWLLERRKDKADFWEKFILGTPEGHFYNTAGGNPALGGKRSFDDGDPAAAPKSIKSRDYWQNTVEENRDAGRVVTISEPMISFTTEERQIVIAGALRRDGAVVGMIGGALPWSLFEARLNLISRTLREALPEHSAFSLIAPSGVYWYHTDPAKVVRFKKDASGDPILTAGGEKDVILTSILAEDDPVLADLGHRVRQGARAVAISEFGGDDPRCLFSAPVGETGYSLLLEVPEGALMANVAELRRELLFVLVLVALIALVLALVVAKKLVTPIVRLSDAAVAVTRGDRRELTGAGSDEIGRLTQGFNQLLRWLDESDRQREEAEQQRFEAVINQLDDALAEIDSDGRVEEANRPFLALHDGASDEHCSIWTLAPWTGDEATWRDRIAEASRGEAVRFECAGGPGEAPRRFEFTLSRVSRGGDDRALVAVGRDITGRVRRAAELAEAHRAAESANAAKSEFLANMSHEIRTPMTAILGYSELLLDPSVSEAERRAHVHTITSNGEHLLAIINDILDLSKIDAGRMEVESIDVAPITIIEEVRSLLEGRAAGKGIELTVSYATPMPATISGDPVRLRQILMNLVGNAIKFTERGAVGIVASVDETAGTPRLRVVVHDTGIGMTRDQVGRLFQPFSQADASMSRRFGGTGLGLLISQRLAAMLGGAIAVESQPGRGSTFTVTVETGPLDGVPTVQPEDGSAPAAGTPRPAPEADGAAPKAAPLDGVRILFAEDGVTNQRLVEHHLRTAGAVVEIAEDGRAACERVAAAAGDGVPFDLVLMDLQMPVMDGYAATMRLRREGHVLPIIALTAHAMASDRTRCFEAGCTGYTTKPIDRTSLLETCRAAVDAANGSGPADRA